MSYSGLMGGSERILLDLTSRLGHLDPVVACPPGALSDALRERGIRVFPLRRRRLELRATVRDRLEKPLRLAGQAVEVHDLVAALRPGALVAWGTRAAIECAAAVRRIDPPPALIFQNNDLLQGPTIARIARAAARRADLIISLSATIARDLDPRGDLEDRSVVVPPGVDLDAYAHIGAPDGEPHVLLLGAMVGWKRPRLGLEAIALASRDVPDIRLTVAGPIIDDRGERLAETLRRRAAEPDLAGRVHFAGWFWSRRSRRVAPSWRRRRAVPPRSCPRTAAGCSFPVTLGRRPMRWSGCWARRGSRPAWARPGGSGPSACTASPTRRAAGASCSRTPRPGTPPPSPRAPHALWSGRPPARAPRWSPSCTNRSRRWPHCSGPRGATFPARTWWRSTPARATGARTRSGDSMSGRLWSSSTITSASGAAATSRSHPCASRSRS